MNAAIGEREGAWIVVTGAQSIAASVDTSAFGPLKAAEGMKFVAQQAATGTSPGRRCSSPATRAGTTGSSGTTRTGTTWTEDWDAFDVVRRKQGAAAVRTILADAGLFSASADGVKLACTLGREPKSATKYSWPVWSKDASTAAKIELARAKALAFASP